MLGMALLGAFLFCLSRSKREQRDAGGSTTGLNPVYSATGAVFHPPPAPGVAKGGNLETGEATFFNVSLNKTTSDLSQVEKAVCGAISAGSAAARPVHVRQQGSQQDSEVCSRSQARHRRRLSSVDEDEHYTTPPPRTWQRRDSERHSRDRSWALEKQLRRALERESDLQWEIERPCILLLNTDGTLNLDQIVGPHLHEVDHMLSGDVLQITQREKHLTPTRRNIEV
ncbi:hypothetical protein FS837_012589 [Tulasnella sp. UAMH 9824]|nr:hypothetical protein FS837_012589 [Tulasnella sp. UAMH 9824]